MFDSNNTQYWVQIFKAAGWFFAIALFFLLVPALVYVDLVVIGHGMVESSVTEYTQETLLLLSALAFLFLAYKSESQRGFALLVGGFFGALFIRELDGVFDQIHHGAWVYFACAWVASICFLAAQSQGQTLKVMAQASQSKGFVYIVIGLAVLLAFSRVFGTRALWQTVLVSGENVGQLKNTIQEGLELLGYQMIFLGSLHYVYAKLRQLTQAPQKRETLVSASKADSTLVFKTKNS